MRRYKFFIVEAPCACIRYSKTGTTNSLRTNNPFKALWSFLRYPETQLSILLSTDEEAQTEGVFCLLWKPERQ